MLTMGIKVQSLLMVGGHHGQSGLSVQEVVGEVLSQGKENVQDHCKNYVKINEHYKHTFLKVLD